MRKSSDTFTVKGVATRVLRARIFESLNMSMVERDSRKLDSFEIESRREFRV